MRLSSRQHRFLREPARDTSGSRHRRSPHRRISRRQMVRRLAALCAAARRPRSLHGRLRNRSASPSRRHPAARQHRLLALPALPALQPGQIPDDPFARGPAALRRGTRRPHPLARGPKYRHHASQGPQLGPRIGPLPLHHLPRLHDGEGLAPVLRGGHPRPLSVHARPRLAGRLSRGGRRDAHRAASRSVLRHLSGCSPTDRGPLARLPRPLAPGRTRGRRRSSRRHGRGSCRSASRWAIRARRPPPSSARCRGMAPPARSSGPSCRSRVSSSATTRAAPASKASYVQEEDADNDADPATSEGVFVFQGSAGTAVAARRCRECQRHRHRVRLQRHAADRVVVRHQRDRLLVGSKRHPRIGQSARRRAHRPRAFRGNAACRQHRR